MLQVDFIIVGGGIFGVYTALFLAEKKYKVCLLEKESGLFKKASVVNQARLHSGYHYPRSISTATMISEYKDRFAADHKLFINTQFENYYAIDKNTSFTNSSQFERFCEFIKIPVRNVSAHPSIDFANIEALYLTNEYSFDPIRMAEYYTAKVVDNKNISILLNSKIIEAEKTNGVWNVQYIVTGNSNTESITSDTIINATYAGINGVNSIFGMKPIELMYELSELAFVRSPELMNIGLTVLDGPFASIIPCGHSGVLSLSSVTYTHHRVSHDVLPVFECQQINKTCSPALVSDCNSCEAKPISNQRKMMNQIKRYLREDVSLDYLYSLYAIKSKLKSSYIDDGRPTEISKLSALPSYYCLFSGKINSIYEIEKLINDEF
jgi:hypothetical protein